MIAAFRLDLGIDYSQYYHAFYSISKAPDWASVFQLRYEAGYLILNRLISYFTNNIIIFMGIYHGIMLLSMSSCTIIIEFPCISINFTILLCSVLCELEKGRGPCCSNTNQFNCICIPWRYFRECAYWSIWKIQGLSWFFIYAG